jgi:phosphoenolpyruvate carboxykinase (ATP)
MASKNMAPKGRWRALIESAMYANSVRKVTMAELYELASKQPEVICTSEPMYKPEVYGLPSDAKLLVSNDGRVVGRTAQARRLVRHISSSKLDKFQGILREAIYHFNTRPALRLDGIVGLHPDFMVKAHLISPEMDAKNMLDWGLNFRPFMEPWTSQYNKSRVIDEPDILVLADPLWSSHDYPDGLVLVDERDNSIAILGMRYFGERKKGTLTLGWSCGVRHNMVACHGGIKQIDNNPPIAVFGLSGSGKSSITNSPDHGGTLKEDEKVTVIHDDAFLIDLDNNISMALEPSLFDKTDEVKEDDPIITYFLSGQNLAVHEDENGYRKVICSDIRNRNGRCIKPRDMFNHKDSCIIAGKVIWLQKDTSLPPIMRIENVDLAVAMGASLSTLRAKGVENVKPEELKKLVIEPFANPFRVHPLLTDCQQFEKLFEKGTKCYIMNTYAFGIPGNLVDIPKNLSLKIVTALNRGEIQWKDWKNFKGLSIPSNGNELFSEDYDKTYHPPHDTEYLKFLRERMQDRITFLSHKRDVDNDMDSAYIDSLNLARAELDVLFHPKRLRDRITSRIIK